MSLRLIRDEVNNLHGVGARLEGFADEHPIISTGLLGVASSVRNAATLLGLLLVTKTEDENGSSVQ
jgi:hypothetical protein